MRIKATIIDGCLNEGCGRREPRTGESQASSGEVCPKCNGATWVRDLDREISVDGVPCDLAASLKHANHSPTGFSWGYYGSGPAQAALAILLAKLAPAKALLLHQRFKSDHVARWVIDENVDVEVDLPAWIHEVLGDERLRAAWDAQTAEEREPDTGRWETEFSTGCSRPGCRLVPSVGSPDAYATKGGWYRLERCRLHESAADLARALDVIARNCASEDPHDEEPCCPAGETARDALRKAGVRIAKEEVQR